MEQVEKFYNKLSHKERDCTSLLLLDSVIRHIVELPCHCDDIVIAAHSEKQLPNAWQERDNALQLARQYRDIAEECQTAKRGE